MLVEIPDEVVEEALSGPADHESIFGLLNILEAKRAEIIENIAAERDATRVTATDLRTGESQTAEIQDNYVIVCAGTCHVAHENHYPKSGTVQLTIKGRR